MRLGFVIGAAALLLLPLAAEAADTALPGPAILAGTTGPAAYASGRGYRHHRGRHHARRTFPGRYAYGFDWPYRVTHPRWPSCYDRPPFHCPPPRGPFIPVADLDLDAFPTNRDVRAPVVRTRWARHRVHRTVLRARG